MSQHANHWQLAYLIIYTHIILARRHNYTQQTQNKLAPIPALPVVGLLAMRVYFRVNLLMGVTVAT